MVSSVVIFSLTDCYSVIILINLTCEFIGSLVLVNRWGQGHGNCKIHWGAAIVIKTDFVGF